eukprot:TRINITY_DN36940_c0_g1_i1.p1 TRINITY_DN36940_c0_g1~~TRINITY_DN36940_c0_g1_i1.p1  ORF type:complete len:145 (+),score=17.32 TRINITY_DN36940_c0_g1_i1:301-735(+)
MSAANGLPVHKQFHRLNGYGVFLNEQWPNAVAELPDPLCTEDIVMKLLRQKWDSLTGNQKLAYERQKDESGAPKLKGRPADVPLEPKAEQMESILEYGYRSAPPMLAHGEEVEIKDRYDKTGSRTQLAGALLDDPIARKLNLVS